MRLSLITALFLVGALATSPVMAAKIYKWVDEKGVTNFGEHPPKNVKAQSIKPSIGHSEPVNYDTPETQTTGQESAQAAPPPSLKDPERCEIARKNLATLQNFGRVRVPNEDGSFHYLTEDEQKERLAETREAIDESC